MIQAHAFLTNKAQLTPTMVQLPSNLHTAYTTDITLSWSGTPEGQPVAYELYHAPSVSMTLQVCVRPRPAQGQLIWNQRRHPLKWLSGPHLGGGGVKRMLFTVFPTSCEWVPAVSFMPTCRAGQGAGCKGGTWYGHVTPSLRGRYRWSWCKLYTGTAGKGTIQSIMTTFCCCCCCYSRMVGTARLPSSVSTCQPQYTLTGTLWCWTQGGRRTSHSR
jgi:hypothetical protein